MIDDRKYPDDFTPYEVAMANLYQEVCKVMWCTDEELLRQGMSKVEREVRIADFLSWKHEGLTSKQIEAYFKEANKK